MHNLLKESPTSRDNPSGCAVCGPEDWADMEAVARAGNFDILRGAAHSRAWIMGRNYCRSRHSIDSCEDNLHSLWYYQCAKHVSHKSLEQDRLVLDIVQTRGRGPLTRKAGVGIDIARTLDGTVWNDMPFLATDMIECWIHDYASMDSKQRLNSASFLAKLASTRIANDRLCQIALVIFRNTFETERHLGSSDKPDDEEPRRSNHGLTIASLLPSACAWIREAGHNIILLSDVSWNECSHSNIGRGGWDFVQSELGQQVPNGFSPWRWLYWLKRLHQIADEASKADEKVLAEQAAKAIEIMLGNVKERNSQILRVFETAGDSVTQDKDFLGLKREW
ncbi:Protein of unknown function DUF3632 [Penicillium cf. griseofulvum]|nr:Protein of unknown function DUF3632 [Penicillium cf. griseofulvum]